MKKLNNKQKKLVEDNTGLAGKIARKYLYTSRYEYNDLVQEGILALINAALNYNENLGTKFSTYAYVTINRHLHKFVGGESRLVNIDNEDEIFIIEENYDKKIDTDNMEKKLKKILNKLEPISKLVLCSRLGILGYQKRGLKDLSKILCVTKEYVRQLENKAIKELKNMKGIEELRGYLNEI